MFQVTTKNLYDLKKDEQGKIIYDDDFFGQQTSLTVSGQLEGELGATSMRSAGRMFPCWPVLTDSLHHPHVWVRR